MSLNKADHIIKELDGVKTRIVESKTTKERVDFLAKLLEYNGYEAVVVKDEIKQEDDPETYTIGVKDITFNPIVKVYNRELRTFDGHRVTPDYWNQKTDEAEPNYWDRSKKDWLEEEARKREEARKQEEDRKNEQGNDVGKETEEK